MKYIDLNGEKIDIIGFGTYKMTNRDAESAVLSALECGYRRIDTAIMYENEEGVGRAIKASGLKEEELFVTTKLWTDVNSREGVRRAVTGSLERLGLKRLDLLLIHWPTPFNDEVWAGMEALKAEGTVRHIGLSNFLPHHIEELKYSVKPEWDQTELHPYFQNRGTLSYLQKRGIVAEAWSPLLRGGALEDKTIKAVAEKYAVTPAAVVLSFLTKEGVAVIPKSTNPAHIAENFRAAELELGEEDVAAIRALDTGKRSFRDPDNHGFC